MELSFEIFFTSIRDIIHIHMHSYSHYSTTCSCKVSVMSEFSQNSNVSTKFGKYSPPSNFMNPVMYKTPIHALYIQHYIILTCWFH